MLWMKGDSDQSDAETGGEIRGNGVSLTAGCSCCTSSLLVVASPCSQSCSHIFVNVKVSPASPILTWWFKVVIYSHCGWNKPVSGGIWWWGWRPCLGVYFLVCVSFYRLCSLPSTVIVCPSPDYFDPTLIRLPYFVFKTCLFPSVFDICFFSVLKCKTPNFVGRKTQRVKIIHLFKDSLLCLALRPLPPVSGTGLDNMGVNAEVSFVCLGLLIPLVNTFYIAPHYVSAILRNASVRTLVSLCCGLVCFMFASLRRLVSALWQQQRGCWDSWLTDCKLLYYSPLGVIKTPIIVTAPQFTHMMHSHTHQGCVG